MDAVDRLPRESLAFLEDLGAHNDRIWFERHRDRCEAELMSPALALVRKLTAAVTSVFPQITGSDSKSGGSLTRLHRDTRFGKDKRPFHTHIGMHFWHRRGRKMEVPGFFLRIAPDEVLLATGLHAPETDPLTAIRKAIDRDPDAWKTASRGPTFVRDWGGLEGESLKRVPAPWSPDHPLSDDLKRKDFTAFVRWKPLEATRPGFAAKIVDRWTTSGPLMGFLCRALALPF